MDENVQKHLYDVLNAVDEINGYFEGRFEINETPYKDPRNAVV